MLGSENPVEAERRKCCQDVCPWCAENMPMALNPLTGTEDPTAHIDADGDKVTCLALVIHMRAETERKG